MKVPVVWLSFKEDTPARGYWDHGMLEQLFASDMWRPAGFGYKFAHYQAIQPEFEGAVVVFPARAQVDCLAQLNEALAGLEWVVLMLTGDEEADFPVENVKHPNIRIWVMSPRPGRHDRYGKLGTGYPPQAREWLPKYEKQAMERGLDYFFAGQLTHKRRWPLQQVNETIKEFAAVNKIRGQFQATEGFTQGDPPEHYYANLADSKVAWAPSGPETPDSFRLFEALEAGCVPLADALDPKGQFPANYWTWFFGSEPPFPVYTDLEQLQGKTTEAARAYPGLNNRVFAWWQAHKRQFAYTVFNDIKEVRGA